MIGGIDALEILGKPFLRTQDIAKLLGCSQASASRVKTDIVNKFYNDQQSLTPGKKAVKTETVIQFLKLDVEEIKKAAERESYAISLKKRGVS